ncbi:MAG: hypothetical protein SFU99_07205 [Saprospiraceae bacterium]|nr:hypothetical protein [Saprospiraceae bacterium]
MRWTLAWIIFHLSFSYLSAQEASEPKSTFHLKLGGGFGLQTVRDNAMSPLQYDGIQGAFQAAGEWRRPQGLYRLDGLFWLGEASAVSGGTTNNYSFAVNGGYLHRLSKEDARWQWRVGPAITTWGSFREHLSLINSDFFYDLFFSLGPSGMVEREFRFFKRDWFVNWQITIPALTYGVRPNYSGLEVVPPDEEGFQGWEDAQFGSFNILQNVKSQIELAYPLKNGNRLGLLYFWDFFKSDLEPHSVKHSMQSVQFSLHFKL